MTMKTFFAGVIWMVAKNAWSALVTSVKLSYYKAKARFRKRREDYQAVRDDKESMSLAAENRIEEAANDVVREPELTVMDVTDFQADYGDES
jgi:hypothetical protein